MTLQQLRYVITVAETGNITQAAQKLFIAQPSLTNAIHELEKEMGISIFTRGSRGVTASNEGDEFLSYARQILDQTSLLEERYLNKKEMRPKFAVSCQHYSFAVKAFAELIRKFDADSYDFTLRETQTHDIIEDVSRMRSELGIIYLSSVNEKVIGKILNAGELVFEEIFTAKPHVFIGQKHPLAKKKRISMKDLEDYPYLSFEQGEYNSFYFSEEILSTLDRKKNIRVCDRATLFNLVIGLDGYTVSSGKISQELNWQNIIARPLNVKEYMKIGIIYRKGAIMSRYAAEYIREIKKNIL